MPHGHQDKDTVMIIGYGVNFEFYNCITKSQWVIDYNTNLLNLTKIMFTVTIQQLCGRLISPMRKYYLMVIFLVAEYFVHINFQKKEKPKHSTEVDYPCTCHEFVWKEFLSPCGYRLRIRIDFLTNNDSILPLGAKTFVEISFKDELRQGGLRGIIFPDMPCRGDPTGGTPFPDELI